MPLLPLDMTHHKGVSGTYDGLVSAGSTAFAATGVRGTVTA